MDHPNPLLTHIARAVLETAPDEIVAGSVLERLPEAARQILDQWQPGRSADQQRTEVQTLGQTTTADVQPLACALADQLTSGRPAELATALASYLRQVPGAIRSRTTLPG